MFNIFKKNKKPRYSLVDCVIQTKSKYAVFDNKEKVFLDLESIDTRIYWYNIENRFFQCCWTEDITKPIDIVYKLNLADEYIRGEK